MELLDEESHRLLLWAVRLDEVGHAATRIELERLSTPRREAGDDLGPGLAGRAAAWVEPAVDALSRRGLVEIDDGNCVRPTRLGRYSVDAVGLEAALPAFEVVEAQLRSGDPLAFARIVGRVAALHRPMVVDPYCRRGELEYLAAHTSVARVLVSDRLAGGELEELADVVRSARRRPVKLRLRVAPAEDLCDRWVISSDRVMAVGGTAQSTQAGATVVAECTDLAPLARDHYRGIWRRAERLASSTPERRRLRVA
jgi:hypothetical protein